MKDSLDLSNQDLDDLFEKYRTSPESYVFVLLADACRKIGRVEEALEICDTGIKRHPKYASGHVVRGKCLYDLDRMAEAEDSFEDVLGIDPNNLVALKYLGMIEAHAGRYDAARRHLKHILRLDPENREIKKAILDIDEQEQLERGSQPLDPGESPRSESAEVRSPAADPIEVSVDSDELATITLADIFASQGYSDKALAIYREVLAKEPGNLAVQRKIAELSSDEDVAPEPPINLPYDGAVEDDDAAGFEEIEAEPTDREGETMGEEAPKPAVEPAKKSAQTEPPKPMPHATVEESPSESGNREIDEERNINHFRQWLRGMRG